jgi:hypothetical protein
MIKPEINPKPAVRLANNVWLFACSFIFTHLLTGVFEFALFLPGVQLILQQLNAAGIVRVKNAARAEMVVDKILPNTMGVKRAGKEDVMY